MRWNEIIISDEVQIEWLCYVRRTFWHNNQVIIISIFEIEATLPTILRVLPFNVQIKQVLSTGRAVAGCDASVKNNVMGVYWIIMDRETKEILMEKEVFSKE